MDVHPPAGRAHLKRKCTRDRELETTPAKKVRCTNTKSKMRKHAATNVLSLPNEILEAIAAYIPSANDIGSLSKVSRTFVEFMNRELYSTSRVMKGSTNLLTLAQFTRTIISNTNLASLVHTLRLGQSSRAFMTQSCLDRFKNLMTDEIQTFRQAGKQKSISCLFGDRSSRLALLDDFHALIVSHLPHLQDLTLNLCMERDRFALIARSQSMDQLHPSLFKTLENLSVRVIPNFPNEVPFGHADPKCPRFITSLLKVGSLRKFSTENVVPDKLPITNINTFEEDPGEAYYWPSIVTKVERSRSFFDGAAKLDTLVWNSHRLKELCSDFPKRVPKTVNKLVLHESTFGGWRYEPSYRTFLDTIETLHLHYNVITHAAFNEYHRYFSKPLDPWLFLLSPRIRTLRIFGLDISSLRYQSLGPQLSKIRTGYFRFPLLGPVQIQAKIDKGDSERDIKQEFEGIKKICGDIPVELLILSPWR